MSTILFLLASAVAMVCCVPDAQAAAILQAPNSLGLSQGLVGWWTFDGNHVSGVHAYDASGNGNRGVMTNGPKLVNGKLGQGMEFDGGDDYVDASSATYSALTEWTNSVWIRPDSTISPGDTIMRLGAHGILLGTNTVLRYFTSGGSFDTSTSAISHDQWQHIVVTRTGSILKFYKNGAEIASFSSYTGGDQPAIDFIGWYATSQHWDGLIDDVRIYNRVLSPDEIKRLYKIGATAKVGTTISNDSLQKGLVGHWSFDGDTVSGTHVYDQSGQGNRGVMTNGPRTTIGKLGQGMEFDGVNDYVNLSQLTLDNYCKVSAAAWFKRGKIGSNAPIIAQTWGQSIQFSIKPVSDGTVQVWASDSGNLKYGYFSSNDTQWHHVVAVFDGSQSGNEGRLKAYLDGVPQPLTYSHTIPACLSGQMIDNLAIGAAVELSSYADGLIDDVRIYNRALSSDEIKRLYNNGATAKVGVSRLNEGLVAHWDFDGYSTQVFDRSGNGNHGTLINMNAVSDYVPSVKRSLGNALDFDGVDDQVNINYSFKKITSGTISARIKTNDVRGVFILQDHNGYNNLDTMFGIGTQNVYTATDGHLSFETHGPTVGEINGIQSTFAINDDAWHHVVVVVNGTTYQLYIDGVLDVEESGKSQSGLFGSPAKVTLGRNFLNAVSLNGLLDDVRIYNRALSPDEIKRLYNMGR